MSKPNGPFEFWSRVQKKHDCWVWLGTKNPRGYGHFYYYGLKSAHRVAFYFTYGFWPKCVCHHCDNPSCVNPTHLFAGDYKTNALDRELKGRGRVPRLKGQETAIAKISNQQALFIMKSRGKIKGKDLANMFGISRQSVCDIHKGRSWTHLLQSKE